jgi:hypothetical protein
MITAASGEAVTVESENWMIAMGKAMAFFDMDAAQMVRWVCTAGPAGQVLVEDPVARRAWTVRPLDMVLKIVALGASAGVEHEATDPPDDSYEYDPGALPPPTLRMPARSNLAPPPMPAPIAETERPEPEPEPRPAVTRSPTSSDVFSPESLAERLFDLSTDIAGADAKLACQLALDLIEDFVPCEAGSVARSTSTGFELTFVAARGPLAASLLGRTLPFGSGFVGLCFEAGIPVQADAAGGDKRHLGRFDAEFGFVTRETLCVPVTRDGQVLAVVQLINPLRPFEPYQVEAVVTVARTLAENLSDSSS